MVVCTCAWRAAVICMHVTTLSICHMPILIRYTVGPVRQFPYTLSNALHL